MRKVAYLIGAAAVATMMAASPASAQYGRYDSYQDPYYDDRDDGFDVATGIRVAGTIASILGAFRGGVYGQPYGYGYRAPYGYQTRPYGTNDYAYSVNRAVNSCGREAQRASGGGRVEIRDIDRLSNGRLRVRGRYDDLRNSRFGYNRRVDRDRFSCVTFGNGAIQDFRVGG
jgi:hypothetical protein